MRVHGDILEAYVDDPDAKHSDAMAMELTGAASPEEAWETIVADRTGTLQRVLTTMSGERCSVDRALEICRVSLTDVARIVGDEDFTKADPELDELNLLENQLGRRGLCATGITDRDTELLELAAERPLGPSAAPRDAVWSVGPRPIPPTLYEDPRYEGPIDFFPE